MKVCCIKNCPTNRRLSGRKVAYFQFPGGPYKKHAWIRAVHAFTSFPITLDNIKFSYLCDLHFTKEQLDRIGAGQRQPSGIPSNLKFENDSQDLVFFNKSKNLPQKWYQCRFCSYQSKWNNNLRKHEERHNKYSEITVSDESLLFGTRKFKSYKCNMCPFQDPDQDAIKLHVASHSNDSALLRCTQCSMVTMSKGGFIVHQKMHEMQRRRLQNKLETEVDNEVQIVDLTEDEEDHLQQQETKFCEISNVTSCDDDYDFDENVTIEKVEHFMLGIDSKTSCVDPLEDPLETQLGIGNDDDDVVIIEHELS